MECNGVGAETAKCRSNKTLQEYKNLERVMLLFGAAWAGLDLV